MKMQCKEIQSYNNLTELFKTSVKELDSIVTYLKLYIDRTKDYIGKIQAMNTKYKGNNQLTAIDNCFQRLQTVIDTQVIANTRIITLIEKNFEEWERNMNESLECQRKLHKDFLEAEDELLSHSKDIEKLKRQYHSEALSLETTLRSFIKKQRNSKKQQVEEENPDILKGISNMNKAEKEYLKKSSKARMYLQNFSDCLSSTSGGIEQLIQYIGNQGNELVYKIMIYIQNAGKEIDIEIKTYLPNIDKPLDIVIPSLKEEEKDLEFNQSLQFNPYKIKSLTQEFHDDYTEEELHKIIKTIAKNMIKKPQEYDIQLEDEKILFNSLVTKMLTFTSFDFCTPKEMKFIEMAVQTHLFRSIFLLRLNSLRTTGMFSWPKEHYVEVGKVIAMILDAVKQENDLETAKNVIILSQTYYFKANEEKVYLLKFIQSHPLFESTVFWEEFMLESIQRELRENKRLDEKLKQNANETKEEYKLKLSNIVLSQLVPIVDNMMGFNIPKEGIITLLNDVLDKYPINEMQRNIIFSVLDKETLVQIDSPQVEDFMKGEKVIEETAEKEKAQEDMKDSKEIESISAQMDNANFILSKEADQKIATNDKESNKDKQEENTLDNNKE